MARTPKPKPPPNPFRTPAAHAAAPAAARTLEDWETGGFRVTNPYEFAPWIIGLAAVVVALVATFAGETEGWRPSF